MPGLPEKSFIHQIESLMSQWRVDHGIAPVNVSYWNPSNEVLQNVQTQAPPSSFLNPLTSLRSCDPIPYRYSQGLPSTEAVLSKLGFSADRVGALITENGTTSISTVANWLKLNGVTEVTLLTPYYFATSHSLLRLGISVREVALERTAGGAYRLPRDLALQSHQAVWLTNPIYSTGLYSLEASCDLLRQIADAGTIVIADESLALRPTAIARSLGGHDNFVGIYTPHKSICMNGVKFSIVVTRPRHQATLEDWAEVLSGGLSLSAIIAIQHFVTSSFDGYRESFSQLMRKTRDWHVDLVDGFDGAIELDQGSEGHFIMAYVPGLAAKLGSRIDFLAEILQETGCIMVPGFHSGFPERSGFCFRINLARDSEVFRDALGRLYPFLRGKTDLCQRRNARPVMAQVATGSPGRRFDLATFDSPSERPQPSMRHRSSERARSRSNTHS
jgi:aspartate/methionine/tyrosine aminotransferase